MSVLFLIPARGGSKGLPGKNIKPMCGKPLIGWSVEAALGAAQRLSGARVIVTTDSQEIAEVGRQFGAEVPFIRPSELAQDTVGHMDVVLHAVSEMEQAGFFADYVVMVEPTSPQRTSDDLLNALDMLRTTENAESLVGVSKTESCHPMFLTKLKTGFLDPYENKDFKFFRRQDTDDVYFFEGSMYISKTTSLKARRSFYHEKTLGFVMPKWKSFEIDDLTDFMLVERLMQARIEGLIK